jgi:hypothetical protein
MAADFPQLCAYVCGKELNPATNLSFFRELSRFAQNGVRVANK